LSAARTDFGTSEGYPALPPGRNLLPPEYVDSYQRRRMVVAVAELAHEEGLAGVTVTGLSARARISRKTFYDYFANREECVDYASKEATAYIFEPIDVATKQEQSVDEQLAAGVGALLEAVAGEPNLAELALIHAPALGGKRGRHFQEVAVEGITHLVGIAGKGGDGDARTAETIASAIIGVVACQLRRGEAERIGELAEELVRLARLAAVGVESQGR
jgi:AcrR family transcriptional regulator